MSTQIPESPPDSTFRPPRCPYPDCAAHTPGSPFPWRRRGTYHRGVDGREVQRFECKTCGRRFSSQTFRLDYRLKKLHLLPRVLEGLASKVTLRQMARTLGVRRRLVEHRLGLLAAHCELQHRHRLGRLARSGGLEGVFLLDELETYETHRILKPVTTAVLIEGKSGLLIHAESAPLPPRRPLSPSLEKRLAEIEAVEGKRRSGSREAVKHTFEELKRVVPESGTVSVITDRKSSYKTVLEKLFGDRLKHRRISSRARRSTCNPLFPINHKLAETRDHVSRLVRRTWAASKKRSRLDQHLWVWIAWRNYVADWRSEPAWKRATSAAVRVKAERRKLSVTEFLCWRDPLVGAA